MKRWPLLLKVICSALGLLLISGTVIVTAQQIFHTKPPLLLSSSLTATSTRPPNCVPIPQESPSGDILTPTPNRISVYTPIPRPTVTPQIYTNIIDLSPQLPANEKSEVIVFRCNGNLDKYLAGSDINIFENLQLEPGDVIIDSVPPTILMGHRPPDPSPRTTVITPSLVPYPSISKTSTSQPYPFISTSTAPPSEP